jgi:hypothetical protein
MTEDKIQRHPGSDLDAWLTLPVEPMVLMASTREWESDADYAAEMTNRQFAALRIRLDRTQLSRELTALLRRAPSRPAKNYREDEVRKWATNGWSTERILQLSAEWLPREQLGNALQWAFPQAYYSAFALILALYKTTGQTETTHTAVLRHFGNQVATGGYPACLAFSATGGKTIAFDGTAKAPASSTIAFEPSDRDSVNTQIAQFLKGTREKELEERRNEKSFKKSFMTKSGKPKKRLTVAEWSRVSAGLGRTSLLSLLYRKRIKSNFGDIDTFLNPNIDAAPLFNDLIHVVACLNFTHELMIAQAIGLPAYRGLQAQLDPVPPFLSSRTAEVIEVLAAAKPV